MKLVKIIRYLLIGLAIGSTQSLAQNTFRNLGLESWTFQKAGDSNGLKAQVPGNIHTDLMANGIIPDPYLNNNEQQVQWVENENWRYQSDFEISKNEYGNAHIILQLKNIDTYAKIYVNEKFVGETFNQFRTWEFDCKPFLNIGKNSLRIEFESAVKKAKELAKNLPYELPGGQAVFCRKGQYQFGWDWGPRLVTCGIGSIQLKYWNAIQLENISYKQSLEKDSSAKLQFTCNIWSDTKTSKTLSWQCSEINANIVSRKISLQKGMNAILVNCKIEKAKFWWSNGLGDAFLYHFIFAIKEANNTIEEKKENIGIRTLQWVKNTDKNGSGFQLELNGKPVFMKGANCIPVHNFINNVESKIYADLVLAAKASHLNMLRVWGGGVYMDDAFYNACDENGILVWQDFMFAGGLYPGDSLFTKNVNEEIQEQVINLRNHACLALWCGNNEVDEAWKNWGYQKQYHYSQSDSTKIANDYYQCFEKNIPVILKKEDPTRYYHPSSPTNGWGRKESMLSADAHYWGVWWGMEPFEKYEEKVGRFMSEYGFEGMPAVTSFQKMMPNYTVKFDSASFLNHQKHPTGYKTIDTYMARDYKVPNNFEDYIYVSQLLQARGMKIAMEAHRRAMPYCMGSLYWQLNDCWPVTSWSSIDYYGSKKAFYYQSKRSFQDVIISFQNEAENIYVYVVSDLQSEKKGKLKTYYQNFSGKIIDSTEEQITIAPNTSKAYKTIKFNANDSATCFIYVKLAWENELRTAIYYHTKPKFLHLEKPEIWKFTINENILLLKSNTLVKDLFLTGKNEQLSFSDNYFDLLPNEYKIIMLDSPKQKNALLEEVQFKSLYDVQKAN